MADRSDHERMPMTLTIVLGVFLVAGLAASRLGPTATAPAANLPDLSGAQIVEVRDAGGRTVLSGEFRDRTDALGNTEKDVALVDRRGRRVIGEIEIEVPGPSGVNTAQELEIDIIDIDPNAKFALFIDDREVLAFTTDDRGSVDMEVHGTPAAPPDGSSVP